jgi:TM2 domain-containing membrane protein YozV
VNDEELFASPKSRTVTLLLAATLGVFGLHRFYVGRVRSGILMAMTLGGLGIWYLYDVIMVATGSFRDDEGRLVTQWEPDSVHVGTLSAGAILDELDALRAEVNELHERVEFAERMLSNPDRGTSSTSSTP